MSTTTINNNNKKRYATVVFDYEASSETELNGKKGEQLVIINDEDIDWICVQNSAKQIGYIPRDYIQEIQPQKPQPQQPVITQQSSQQQQQQQQSNENNNARNPTSTTTPTATTTTTTTLSKEELWRRRLEEERLKREEEETERIVASKKNKSHVSLSSSPTTVTNTAATISTSPTTSTSTVNPPFQQQQRSTIATTNSRNHHHHTHNHTHEVKQNSGNQNGSESTTPTSNTKVSELRKSLFLQGMTPLSPLHQQQLSYRKPLTTTTTTNTTTSSDSTTDQSSTNTNNSEPTITVASFVGKLASMKLKKNNNSSDPTTVTASPRTQSSPRSKSVVIPQSNQQQQPVMMSGSDPQRSKNYSVASPDTTTVVDEKSRITSRSTSFHIPNNNNNNNNNSNNKANSPDSVESPTAKKNSFANLQNMLQGTLGRPKSGTTFMNPFTPNAANNSSASAVTVGNFNTNLFTGRLTTQEMYSCELISSIATNYLLRKRLREYVAKDASLKDARIRKNLVQEIYTTEVSYVSALTTIKDKFLEPITTSKKILKEAEISVLFGPIDHVLNVHRELLTSMEFEFKKHNDQMNNRSSTDTITIEHVCIGKVIARIAPFLKLYTDYVNNFDSASVLYEKLIVKNRKFSSFVDKLTADSVTLPGYLIQPIQRIPRIRLLLEDLIRRTPQDHIDYEHIQKAYNAILNIATFINEHKRQSDHSNYLRQVQDRLDPNILMPHRRCVFAGTVTAMIETSVRCTQTFTTVANNFAQYQQEQELQLAQLSQSEKIVMRQKQQFKVFVFNDLCFLVDDPNQSVDQRYNSDDVGVYLCYLLFSRVYQQNSNDMVDMMMVATEPFQLDTVYKGENMSITFYSTASSIGTAMSQDHSELFNCLQLNIEQTRRVSIGKNNVQEEDFDQMLSVHLELIHKIPRRTSELSHIKDRRRETNKKCVELQQRISEREKQIEELMRVLREEKEELLQREDDNRSLGSYEGLITDEYKQLCQDKLRGDELLKSLLSKDSFAYNLLFVPKIWRGRSVSTIGPPPSSSHQQQQQNQAIYEMMN